MTFILLLMKGFPTGSSGISSTVVVVVCINLWFWSAAFGIPVGITFFLCGHYMITQSLGKYSVGGLYWSTLLFPVDTPATTVVSVWEPWSGLKLAFASRKRFAAAALCEYGICSELIFLLWGLPACTFTFSRLKLWILSLSIFLLPPCLCAFMSSVSPIIINYYYKLLLCIIMNYLVK